MSFGEHYARAYDALYESKDYKREAHFVLSRLRQLLGDAPMTILDLGCGTGLHAVALAEAGQTVLGVDVSLEMLSLATSRADKLDAACRSRLTFRGGDARHIRIARKFDAVVSLFHVMSYMANPGDFDAALATVRAHLKPGGALLFDFWYGPAVLADPPRVRERIVEDARCRIRRRTIPDWDCDHDSVRIIYDVETTDLTRNSVVHARETHVLRYFFEHALTETLNGAGFKIAEMSEWLTDRPPTPNSFGVFVLAKLNNG